MRGHWRNRVRGLTDTELDYLFDLNGFRIIRGALDPTQLGAINGWLDAIADLSAALTASSRLMRDGHGRPV